MRNVRIDVRELGAAGGYGGPLHGQTPVLVDARPVSGSGDATARRTWYARGARLVRNAAIVVAMMTLVPVGLVAVRGDWLARRVLRDGANIEARVDLARAVRPFALQHDPSITPMRAGLALNATQQSQKPAPGFELIEPASRVVYPWQLGPIEPGMFPTARPQFYSGPSTPNVLVAAAKGFSAREREYLHFLATSPVWREFDLVARAPAVDIVGGRFRLPFGPGATAEQRPIPKFGETKELAYAAVSRAAYHMSLGQKDSAETVLRSIVSFGLAYVDNGTSTIETIIGAVVVAIGRDALQQFYSLEGDPRAAAAALARPPKIVWTGEVRRPARLSAHDARRQVLTLIENPHAARGHRFDSIRSLAATPCTNVRDLLLGQRDEVTETIARAQHTLARYPSERAVLDLQATMPHVGNGSRGSNPLQALAISSASVAGTVLRNPRLVSCTVLLTGG